MLAAHLIPGAWLQLGKYLSSFVAAREARAAQVARSRALIGLNLFKYGGDGSAARAPALCLFGDL